MLEIIPTITAYTPDKYAHQMAMLASFAPRLHIDITDGDFAPSQTINLNQVYWDKSDVLHQIDLHLMVRRPIDWLDQIVALAPDLVILHAESDESRAVLPRMFEHLRKFEIKVGLALLSETNPSEVREIIELADHVLIFGGHLGYQGGEADLSQLEKIATIQSINPGVEIAWDGGANLDNVVQIAQAGINAINVGSAIAKSDDPRASYLHLCDIITTKL